jgi:threonine dehydratase
VAVAVADRLPSARVVGVRVADVEDTIADGIAVKSPCALTQAHIDALVDDVVRVDDDEIGRALVLLLERAKSVVEPAGAVGLAALLAGLVAGDGPAVVVLSGGNVDPLLLVKLIDHGLSAAGRFLRLVAVVPDRPGALAELTAVIADLGVNILDVEHHREGVRVGVDEVEVQFTLETRDRAHGDDVVAALTQRGIQVRAVR